MIKIKKSDTTSIKFKNKNQSYYAAFFDEINMFFQKVLMKYFN
jgi:hypothetical protein